MFHHKIELFPIHTSNNISIISITMFQNLYKAVIALFVCSCMSTPTIAKTNLYEKELITEYMKTTSEETTLSQSSPQPRDDFSGITYANTVPFVPPITYGKVIKVYDGDTITIAGKLPYPESPVYRIAVRLNGIDTPEIKGQTQKDNDLAKQIRNTLHDKIFDKIVELKNTSSEKYGRLLADVYLDGICINEWLIDQGFAVKYNGGTKERPEEWTH